MRVTSRLAAPGDELRAHEDRRERIAEIMAEHAREALSDARDRRQLFPGASLFGYVDEVDHRAEEVALAAERRRRVDDPDRRTVCAPEHLVFEPYRPPLAEGLEDRAFPFGIRASIGVRVVDDVVHLPAEQLFRRREAKHPEAGWIDERAPP